MRTRVNHQPDVSEHVVGLGRLGRDSERVLRVRANFNAVKDLRPSPGLKILRGDLLYVESARIGIRRGGRRKWRTSDELMA